MANNLINYLNTALTIKSQKYVQSKQIKLFQKNWIDELINVKKFIAQDIRLRKIVKVCQLLNLKQLILLKVNVILKNRTTQSNNFHLNYVVNNNGKKKSGHCLA